MTNAGPIPYRALKGIDKRSKEWLRGLKNQIVAGSGILFSGLDFTASNITSIATRAHNNLQSVDGGTTNQYYHLTSAQHTYTTTGIYGGMYITDSAAQTIVVPAANTDYDLATMTTGTVTGMTFQNGKEFLIATAGKYKITWSMSVAIAAGAAITIEAASMINSTRQTHTIAQQSIALTTDTEALSGCGIITCIVNDVVKLVIRNETDTNDLVIKHANCTITFVGE